MKVDFLGKDNQPNQRFWDVVADDDDDDDGDDAKNNKRCFLGFF